MMSKSKKKIGAIYSRVSDQESASKEHGSLEQQEHIAREAANLRTKQTGIEHVIQYVLTEKEGLSGSHTNRPEYQRLWDLIDHRQIDFVIAKEVSRLNRSTKDFCALLEHCKANEVSIHIKGVDLDFKSPMGDLMYKQFAIMAEFERSMLIERTRSGVRSGRINNSKIHGTRLSLGFDRHPEKTGVWVPNKKELKQVDRLLELVTQHDTFKSIIAALDREGILNKYGTPFQSDSLRRLVFNRKLEGILEFKDGDELIQKKLAFGLVVDPIKLEAAREKIREFDSRFIGKTRTRNRNYLLTGLLAHSDGSTFQGLSGTSKTGNKHFYYRCRKRRITIDADDLEKAVIKAIACYKDESEVQRYTAEAVAQISTSLDVMNAQIDSMRRNQGELRKKEEKILDTLLDRPEGNTLHWLEGQLKRLKDETGDLEKKIQGMEREKTAIERQLPDSKNMQKTLEYVFLNFADAEPSVQRTFLRQIFDRIEVTDDNQVKLFWRFPDMRNPPPSPDRGTGGRGFVLGRKWGG